MKADNKTVIEIEKLFENYVKEIEYNESLGLLKKNTKDTYILHSSNFVKWVKDEFEPGLRNKNKK